MQLSRPVQVWLGFPPVHADHSSLVTRVIPPMRGTRGLELEAGSSTGAVNRVGNSKTDSSSVARVLAWAIASVRQTSKGSEIPNPPGLPRPSTAVPRIPATGLSGRFVGDVHQKVGLLTIFLDGNPCHKMTCVQELVNIYSER